MDDFIQERTTAAVQEQKLSSKDGKAQIYLEFTNEYQNIANFWSARVLGICTIQHMPKRGTLRTIFSLGVKF